jgi:hypothetical protein
MIDSTKSPMPAWKRYAVVVVLAVLLVVAGYVLWKKELHHASSGNSAPPATAAPSQTVHSRARPSTAPTTIPGGIQPSNRDPFGS